MQIAGFNLIPLAIGSALGLPAAWLLGGWAAIFFVIALGGGKELLGLIKLADSISLGDTQAFAIGGILATVAVLAFK